MSYKLLAHNWIAHPLAGLLWYLADKLAEPLFHIYGDYVHGLWNPTPEHEPDRWQAEFNLVYYGHGLWSASDARDMSDEQLAFTLEALHHALSAGVEAHQITNQTIEIDGNVIEGKLREALVEQYRRRFDLKET